MPLFGVTVETEDGTEFFAVVAESDSGAQVFAAEQFFNVGTATFYIDSLEDLLNEQYNGIALLGTT